MARGMVFGLVGFLLLSSAGCGGPDSLIKSLISDMNALADAIERGDSVEKQKVYVDRMKATVEKLEKLNLKDDEQRRLKQKYEAEAEKAAERLEAARDKARAAGRPVVDLDD